MNAGSGMTHLLPLKQYMFYRAKEIGAATTLCSSRLCIEIVHALFDMLVTVNMHFMTDDRVA